LGHNSNLAGGGPTSGTMFITTTETVTSGCINHLSSLVLTSHDDLAFFALGASNPNMEETKFPEVDAIKPPVGCTTVPVSTGGLNEYQMKSWSPSS
jgi:hypothetical protein